MGFQSRVDAASSSDRTVCRSAPLSDATRPTGGVDDGPDRPNQPDEYDK